MIRSLIADQRGPLNSDAAPDNTTGLFITLHSFGDLVLWPWGFTSGAAPNKDGLQTIGDKLASYNGYRSCQPSTCLYGASGTSDDWAYGELGIPSFTFEVGQWEFMPPYGEIDFDQWPKNEPALHYAAKIARNPYTSANGPDARSVSVTTTQTSLALTAIIDDSENGDQPIVEASFTVDAPYWASGAITHTLSAVDGLFDSAIEVVEASIDPTGLSLGQHTFFVRGRDSTGYWGPVSATFGQVRDPQTTFFAIVLVD